MKTLGSKINSVSSWTHASRFQSWPPGHQLLGDLIQRHDSKAVPHDFCPLASQPNTSLSTVVVGESLTLKWDYPRLSAWALKSNRRRQMRCERAGQRDQKCEKGLNCHFWFWRWKGSWTRAGGQPLDVDSYPGLSASQDMGILVLQQPGIDFYQEVDPSLELL